MSTQKKKRIYYVSALCGAGKTYQMTAIATLLAGGGAKICIAVPTIKLANEIYLDLLAQPVLQCRLQIIHHQTLVDGDTGVGRKLVNYLKHPHYEGEILIITQASLFLLPYFHGAEKWTLICDEIPCPLEVIDLNTPDTHSIITGNLNFFPFSDPLQDLNLIFPKDTKRLEKIAYNPNKDAIYGVIQPLAQYVLSRNYCVYIEKALIDRIQNHGGKEKHKLIAFAELKPSFFEPFNNVIMMGALFEKSLAYLLWKNRVNFTPYNIIHKK